MTNKLDTTAAIGGRSLTLRFSAKALAALQDHWQLENLGGVNARLAAFSDGSAPIGDLAVILWSMTRTHHPEITIDEAMDLVDDGGIEVLQAAFAAATPAETGDGAEIRR